MDIGWNTGVSEQAYPTADHRKEKRKTRSFELEQFSAEVLPVLAKVRAFTEKYKLGENGLPDVFVLTHSKKPTLVMEVVAQVPGQQTDRIGSHKFATHHFFQEVMRNYCQRVTQTEKMEKQLNLSRAWDVAVHMIMKVEYIGAADLQNPKVMLLRREAKILEQLWEENKKKKYEMEEMIGIPLFFEYKEMPYESLMMRLTSAFEEIDIYGSLVPLVPTQSNSISCLKYLTMEKTGPSLHYLLDLYEAGMGRGSRFDFATAFKVFDQLICRLMHLHKLSTVYNNLALRTVAFGRQTAFNVVYLSSFSAATKVLSTWDARSKKRHVPLYGTTRFASYFMMIGSDSHPFQDLESAFYVLLAMLMPELPWDGSVEGHKLRSGRKKKSEEADSSDTEDCPALRKDNRKEQLEVTGKKAKLWNFDKLRGNEIIDEILNVILLNSKDSAGADLASSRIDFYVKVIKQLHSNLLDMIKRCKTNDSFASTFCTKLNNTKSSEFLYYYELRKLVLGIFHFKKLKGLFLEDTVYKKERDRNKSNISIAFDTASWCFLSIYITTGEKFSSKGATTSRPL